jgi:protein involved in polysaccharide export with SLBB domain
MLHMCRIARRWMPHPRTLLALLLLIAVAACSSAALPPAPNNAEGGDYRLGSGDKVTITVFGDDSLSGQHQVEGNGMMSFPLIGSVRAAGLTKAELQQQLTTKLQQYLRDPRIALEIDSYRPFYIMGEVTKPGSYPYVDGMTVLNAVAIAGGFTYRAKEDGFDLRRSSNNSSFRAAPLTPVQPGDVIVVKERYF